LIPHEFLSRPAGSRGRGSSLTWCFG